MAIRIFYVCCLCIFPQILSAAELTGSIALDTRIFFSGTSLTSQRLNSGPTLVIEPEYYHVWNDEKDSFTFEPFARLDSYDRRRNHVDIRQFDWIHTEDTWEIRAGMGKVFWGVIESNHLVDIINQTDNVEDIDGEDKLGQPMVQWASFTPYGTFRIFYLPFFRERTFNSITGRPTTLFPIDSSAAIFASSAKQWHQDIALRYTHTIGNWDIGLAHFSGTSREPNINLTTLTTGEIVGIPFYQTIDQTSLDLQLTTESWLWKFEGLIRSGHGKNFGAFSAGFEYSFYGVWDTNMDIGLLAEYHKDNRSSLAPASFLEDDVFLGTRIALNNVYDTEILSGILIDTNNSARSFSLEASHRVGERWKLTADIRLFNNLNPADTSLTINKDDHLQFRIARFF